MIGPLRTGIALRCEVRCWRAGARFCHIFVNVKNSGLNCCVSRVKRIR